MDATINLPGGNNDAFVGKGFMEGDGSVKTIL
jgi:hypothetical protein